MMRGAYVFAVAVLCMQAVAQTGGYIKASTKDGVTVLIDYAAGIQSEHARERGLEIAEQIWSNACASLGDCSWPTGYTINVVLFRRGGKEGCSATMEPKWNPNPLRTARYTCMSDGRLVRTTGEVEVTPYNH